MTDVELRDPSIATSNSETSSPFLNPEVNNTVPASSEGRELVQGVNSEEPLTLTQKEVDSLDTIRQKIAQLDSQRTPQDSPHNRKIRREQEKYFRQQLAVQPESVLRELAVEDKTFRDLYIKEKGKEFSLTQEGNAEDPLTVIEKQVQLFKELLVESAKKLPEDQREHFLKKRLQPNVAAKRRTLIRQFAKKSPGQAGFLSNKSKYLDKIVTPQPDVQSTAQSVVSTESQSFLDEASKPDKDLFKQVHTYTPPPFTEPRFNDMINPHQAARLEGSQDAHRKAAQLKREEWLQSQGIDKDPGVSPENLANLSSRFMAEEAPVVTHSNVSPEVPQADISELKKEEFAEKQSLNASLSPQQEAQMAKGFSQSEMPSAAISTEEVAVPEEVTTKISEGAEAMQKEIQNAVDTMTQQTETDKEKVSSRILSRVDTTLKGKGSTAARTAALGILLGAGGVGTALQSDKDAESPSAPVQAVVSESTQKTEPAPYIVTDTEEETPEATNESTNQEQITVLGTPVPEDTRPETEETLDQGSTPNDSTEPTDETSGDVAQSSTTPVASENIVSSSISSLSQSYNSEKTGDTTATVIENTQSGAENSTLQSAVDTLVQGEKSPSKLQKFMNKVKLWK